MNELERSRLELAIAFASKAHHGQVYHGTREDEPFILHCVRVVDRAASPSGKVVAALHDVLEDTDTTEPPDFLTIWEAEALRLVTRPKGMPYDQYIRKIAAAQGTAGNIAREVKQADLAENLSCLHEGNRKALRPKYTNALIVIAEAMDYWQRNPGAWNSPWDSGEVTVVSYAKAFEAVRIAAENALSSHSVRSAIEAGAGFLKVEGGQ